MKQKQYVLDGLEGKIGIDGNSNFINIIQYAIRVYNLSVKNVAQIFGYTRQNIHIYNKGNKSSHHSNELPEKIKSKVCEIYNVSTLEKVYEIEHQRYISNQIDTNDDTSIKSSKDITYFYDVIDSIQTLWNNACNEGIKIEQMKESDKYIEILLKHLNLNSKEYNKKLINVLTNTKNNDNQLLQLMNNYLYEQATKTGILTEDSKEIEKHMDRVMNAPKNIIALDQNDFHKIPKYHFIQEVVDSEDICLDAIDIKLSVHSVIISITANVDVRLYDINIAVEKIQQKFGEDIKIIYGAIIDEEASKMVVDIFLVE